jgi:hypothetical protein
MERLEHKANVMAPQLRKGTLGQLVDAPLAEPQLARSRAVQPAEKVEEG